MLVPLERQLVARLVATHIKESSDSKPLDIMMSLWLHSGDFLSLQDVANLNALKRCEQ